MTNIEIVVAKLALLARMITALLARMITSSSSKAAAAKAAEK